MTRFLPIFIEVAPYVAYLAYHANQNATTLAVKAYTAITDISEKAT